MSTKSGSCKTRLLAVCFSDMDVFSTGTTFFFVTILAKTAILEDEEEGTSNSSLEEVGLWGREGEGREEGLMAHAQVYTSTTFDG